MTETTTEQLAEIEGQAENTPGTGYTPPEGWRVLAVGEVLRDGDMWVWPTNDQLRQTVHVGAVVGANQRYIRPIESQPQPQPVQVREGRWRTRGGEVKNIRPCEPLQGAYYVWPWTDGFMTFQDNGLHQGSKESPNDLVEYLGPIEQQPEPVPAVQGGLVRDVTHLLEESGVLDSAKAEQQIEELRSEVSYVQRLLGESRQRVTQLEELVGSLRTINEGQEKAFEAAGQDNTALRNQLEAAKAELVQERLERNRWHNQVLRVTAELDDKTTQCEILQIELDAAQQVPADSPELRQLRADLEQATLVRDTYHDGYNRLLSDLETARETAKAEAVEAIVEWLQPVQAAIAAADNVAESTRAGWLAEEVIQHLPKIMRSLVGLESPEDVD